VKRAILFIHGIVGHPNQFRLFDPCIPKDIHSYYLLLKGHGGSVDDFAKATMEDWQKQVDEKLEELSSLYDAVYLVGHSMGTLFSLQRMNHPKVKGLFLLAVPLSFSLRLRPFIQKAQSALKKPKEVPPNPTIGVELENNPLKYILWLPNVRALLKEARRTKDLLKKENPKIPCVIFQSAKDELVAYSSAKSLQESGFTVRWLKHSTHHIYTKADADILKQAFALWIHTDM
jgi:esterase/lipase